jgi:hypothetical protein
MEDPVVQRTVARVALSTIEDPDALDRLWSDLVDAVNARRGISLDGEKLLRSLCGHAAAWYAERRGAQAGWPYHETAALARLLREALVSKATGTTKRDGEARRLFQEHALRLHARAFAPYPACERVCDQQPPVCLYRSAVSDVISSGRYGVAWTDAELRDTTSEQPTRRAIWELSMDAGYEAIEFPEEDWSPEKREQVAAAGRRASLCFSQQMLASDPGKIPRMTRAVIDQLLAEA